MRTVVDRMLRWSASHTCIIALVAICSALLFAFTLVALPLFFVIIPEDFFVHRQVRFPLLKKSHPLLRALLIITKNMLGLLFLLSGFLMLFLPGQGLLTLLAGIICIDFAGKRTLICRVIRNKKIAASINGIRKQFGKKPLSF